MWFIISPLCARKDCHNKPDLHLSSHFIVFKRKSFLFLLLLPQLLHWDFQPMPTGVLDMGMVGKRRIGEKNQNKTNIKTPQNHGYFLFGWPVGAGCWTFVFNFAKVLERLSPWQCWKKSVMHIWGIKILLWLRFEPSLLQPQRRVLTTIWSQHSSRKHLL